MRGLRTFLRSKTTWARSASFNRPFHQTIRHFTTDPTANMEPVSTTDRLVNLRHYMKNEGIDVYSTLAS
jgi:hypothetical protein